MSETLTRAFFEAELKGLQEAFTAEAGAEKVYVDLILQGGSTVRMEGEPVCTDTYLAFDRKSGAHKSRTVLLYKGILGVNFSAENEKKVGFHR
ncbi:MAG TPA: hypothetical protein VNT75_06090 [Symbiobacteriaceae bacterium]|nr:hypothetical protein [Symbiobacteriaceae bacterium]